MSGFVYAIECGTAVKIGWSIDPHSRMAAMQTGIVETLTLAGYIKGSRSREKELHREFARWHIRGEWFKNEGEVVKFLANIKLETKLNPKIIFDSRPKSKRRLGRPIKLLDVVRVVHVSLSAEQEDGLNAEWVRRRLETSVDVFRALLDEAVVDVKPKESAPPPPIMHTETKKKMGRPVKFGAVARVVHVAISAKQDKILTFERHHHRKLETRADVLRALLDEAIDRARRKP